MEASTVGLRLSDYDVADIELFCEIASMHDSFLSTHEAVTLLGLEASAEDLERTWHFNPHLNDRYALKSGVIIPRDIIDDHELAKLETHETTRRSIAQKHVSVARDFAALTRSKNMRLISVSGSVSYRSASEKDDIDLFCITARGTTWIYITGALLLARVYRLLNRQPGDICLSCIMDEEYAEKQFAKQGSPLFARDALSVHVIAGSEYYESLLSRNPWITRYFPKLYRERTSSTNPSHHQDRASSSFIIRATNLFLFHTAGRYIWLKAFLLNRRLANKGWTARLFNPLMDSNHCIYESRRYSALRRKYEQLRSPLFSSLSSLPRCDFVSGSSNPTEEVPPTK